MNDEVVLSIVLLVISLYEVWLYYQMLFGLIIEKKYINRSSRVILWLSIIVIGVSLGIKRKILFFSDSVFFLAVMLLVFFSFLIIKRKIFLTVSLVLIYCAFVSLLDFLFAFIGMDLLNEKFDKIIYFNGVSVQKIMVYVFSRMITTVLVIIVRKSDLKKNIFELRKILFSLGIIFVMLVRGYQIYLASMVMGKLVQNGTGGILSLGAIIVIISFIGMILSKNKMIKNEYNFLIFKEELEQRKYEELSAALEKNKELVHDIKNHCLVISEYVNRRDYQKLNDYVEELKGEFIKVNPHIYTGNYVIDLMLSQKKMLSEQKNIVFTLQAMPLSKLPFKDREICTIFGNLLDNAIEACEKVDAGERWISVKMEIQNHLFFVQITNTIQERPQESKRGFLTSKMNKELHGFGLKSVQRIVDDYEGDILYQIENNTFTVRLSFFDIE